MPGLTSSFPTKLRFDKRKAQKNHVKQALIKTKKPLFIVVFVFLILPVPKITRK